MNGFGRQVFRIGRGYGTIYWRETVTMYTLNRRSVDCKCESNIHKNVQWRMGEFSHRRDFASHMPTLLVATNYSVNILMMSDETAYEHSIASRWSIKSDCKQRRY